MLIALPPLSEGAVHVRDTEPSSALLKVRPVGAEGTPEVISMSRDLVEFDPLESVALVKTLILKQQGRFLV